MTQKTRLIALFVCIVCFFLGTAILIPYSMGYRFDFSKMKITATGGIYIKTNPIAEEVIIDSKIKEKPGMTSSSVFVQSLLPQQHSVLVKKTGYFDYSKTIPVQEKQVTKLEDILLIKKSIQFKVVEGSVKSPFDKIPKFILKNSSLYYSNSPENSAISNAKKATPLLNKVIAFSTQNDSIIWLKSDGILYKSDSLNPSETSIAMTTTPVRIISAGIYKIINYNKYIVLNSNGNLLILNDKTKDLESFAKGINDAKISPDGKNIIYYNNNYIYLSSLPITKDSQQTLYKSIEKINDCIWLNGSYIIFTEGLNKIKISEIDYRDNINIVTLPQIISVSENKEINIKSPKIYFDQQEQKLFILTGSTLLSSERMVPQQYLPF